jgi:hypothetical protein
LNWQSGTDGSRGALRVADDEDESTTNGAPPARKGRPPSLASGRDRSAPAPAKKKGSSPPSDARGTSKPKGGATGSVDTATRTPARSDTGPSRPAGAPRGGAAAGPTRSSGFSAWGTWPIVIGAFLLTVVALPTVGTSDWPPEEVVALVVGVAGLPLLLARAIGRPDARRSESEVWAARLAIGFVLAGAISTATSIAPVLSTFGPYFYGTGLLFMVLATGWWALGTGLTRSGRRLLESALIAGAVVNASLAVLQQLFGLGALGLAGLNGQPDGFVGNPVFLGALLAASLVLLAPRVETRPQRWAAAVAVVGVGLGVDGQRLPALLALVVVVWVAVTAWRRHRRDPDDDASAWHRALLFGGVTVASILIGSLVATGRGGLGVIRHTADSTTNETFGERFHAWGDALHAIGAHPLIGSGPGLFNAAVSRYYSLAEVRIDGSDLPLFYDAHNFLLEFTTTTGILGVVLLVAWLVLSVRGRSGPLLGFAAVIGVMELVEPLNVVITPLALLALGAATLGGRPMVAGPDGGTAPARRDRPRAARVPRWAGPAGLALSVLALIPATVLVIGDVDFASGITQYARGQDVTAAASASTATTLLAPWRDPAILLEDIHLTFAASGLPGQLAQAEHWARVVVARDPSDAEGWTSLAQIQGETGHPTAARQSALRALADAPWFAPALDVLGVDSALRQDNAAAERDFRRSLEADPDQKDYRSVLIELEKGCTVPRGTAASHLELVCPR